MIPYELTLLIHIRTTCSEFPYSDSPIYAGVIDSFKELEVINPYTESKTGYQLTGLGIAWLGEILSTPLPKIGYVDSEGKLIN